MVTKQAGKKKKKKNKKEKENKITALTHARDPVLELGTSLEAKFPGKMGELLERERLSPLPFLSFTPLPSPPEPRSSLAAVNLCSKFKLPDTTFAPIKHV